MNHVPKTRMFVHSVLVASMVFSLISAASAQWKEKVLYSFQGGTDGALPSGGLIRDRAGNLYGVTYEGGSTACPPGWCGTVYELSPPTQKGSAWTETVIYVFKGHDQSDGSGPSGGLIADSAGNLYGVTGYGGSGPCILFGTPTGCGAVFELSPPAQQGEAWSETVLYNFQGDNDGDLPTGPLVFDKAGNLYGATEFGGGQGITCDIFYGGNCGTVFELSPSQAKGGQWTEKVLHSFAGGTDGATPNGGLVLPGNGNAIYGTTVWGGNTGCANAGCGTVFALSAGQNGTWTEELVHVFQGGNDGASPVAGLTYDGKGYLYGTTADGGAQQDGVVFRMTKRGERWTGGVVHTFIDNVHGRAPSGSVTFDSVGNLYGLAGWGQYFGGVIYRMAMTTGSNSWSYSLPYEFKGSPDGSNPYANVILDTSGNIYGTTQNGGTGQTCQGGCGTVFETGP